MSWYPIMAIGTLKPASSSVHTLAELLDRLGNIPLQRIRFRPFPGTATEKDVLTVHRSSEKRLCELIDGVLVEKAMGTREALLASLVGHILWDFLEKHDLGIVLGADGMLRLWPGMVRIPDVSFISWDRLPEGKLPEEAIAGLAPDLAIEILSEGNTRQEIDRKIQDFFDAGTQLVWVIDGKKQSAKVYHSPTDCTAVGKNGSLDGEDVLPGFLLAMRKLFARTGRRSKG